MTDGTNCSNPINIGKYIQDFTCLGFGSNTRMLKEMRLSFPSGHASFSAYTMIYCAVGNFLSSVWNRWNLIFLDKYAFRFTYKPVWHGADRSCWNISSNLYWFYFLGILAWQEYPVSFSFCLLYMKAYTWWISQFSISDYKHHWSDVLAGATLGTFCALIVVRILRSMGHP